MSEQLAFPTVIKTLPTITLGGGSGFTLWQHQCEALDGVAAALVRNVRRQLIVMPTGSGKTGVFSAFPERFGWEDMLVIAHRRELIDQNRSALHRANPTLKLGTERADEVSDDDARTIVASIQTLGRVDTQRLLKFPPNRFKAIIVDEAHHTPAQSYLNVLSHFGVGQPGGPILIGVTATPMRGDNEPLANVFDEVVYSIPMIELMTTRINPETGRPFLCEPCFYRIEADVDFSDLKTSKGDFTPRALAKRANVNEWNSTIIRAIEQHAEDRSTILVFTTDSAHSEAVAAQLRSRGHAAESVTQYTSSQDRYKIASRFHDGETRILVNCQVYTEGYDEPSIDCIVMAHPTKSPSLYAQMLGRGTRQSLATGKLNCKVLDLVGVCGQHAIVTGPQLFGLRDIDLLGTGVVQAMQDVFDKAKELGVQSEAGDSIEKMRERVEVIELLAEGTSEINTTARAVTMLDALSVPQFIEQRSVFPWVCVGQDRFVLDLITFNGTNPRMYFWRDALGRWLVKIGKTPTQLIAEEGRCPWKIADRLAKRTCGWQQTASGYRLPLWKTIAHSAKWRRRDPTDKQREGLAKFGVLVLPEGMTRGAAQTALTQISMLRALAARKKKQVA